MAASPHFLVFMVYDSGTGLPKAGALGSLAFVTYKDETGSNITTPTLVEIGGGLYGFIPNYTAGHGAAFVISTGNNPAYVYGFTRPEDWYIDNTDWPTSNLKEFQQGSWEIKTTGPDANKMIFYGTDGVTVLHKFALTDQSGNPTFTNPFKRSV